MLMLFKYYSRTTLAGLVSKAIRDETAGISRYTDKRDGKLSGSASRYVRDQSKQTFGRCPKSNKVKRYHMLAKKNKKSVCSDQKFANLTWIRRRAYFK